MMSPSSCSYALRIATEKPGSNEPCVRSTCRSSALLRGLVGASLHHARAVCRRAERDVVPLVREAECEAAVAVYLNRLSDYLFVAARFAARRIGEEDAVYQKARVRGG